MGVRAAIVGIAGTVLSDAERALFKAHPPAGVILFARNVGAPAPAQLHRLTAALRAVLPEAAVLMVDQEGGRVARLRPPHWRGHPPAATLGVLYDQNAEDGERAAWLTGALIGLDCREAGFDVAAAPVLDLRVEGAHDIIGNRAFSADPVAVGRLGAAVAAGLRAAGVQPVGKHIPGHGRALADSHLELPRLSNGAEEDLLPFIANAGIGWAMTAHIVYEDWDAARPATLSPVVIGDIIRRRCGFDGVLVSDDLTMQALSGSASKLAAAALSAGCDVVLHCNGVFSETEALLATCPRLSAAAVRRMTEARAAAVPEPLEGHALTVERESLIGGHGH